MALEAKPLTVDLIAGLAANVCQFMAVTTAQTAWKTYAGSIATAATIADIQSATAALDGKINPASGGSGSGMGAFTMAEIGAVLNAAVQLLNW